MLPNNATTQVINGVTFTVNDDGSITVNGTATARVDLIIGSLKVKSGTTYRIDDGLNNLVYDEGLALYTVSSPVQTGSSWYWRTDYDSSHNIRVRTANTDATVTVNIRVAKDFTVDNVTIKPMFCIGSYKGTYVPYAKSNKALTDDVGGLISNLYSTKILKQQIPTNSSITITFNASDRFILTVTHSNQAEAGYMGFGGASATSCNLINVTTPSSTYLDIVTSNNTLIITNNTSNNTLNLAMIDFSGNATIS